MAYSRLGRYEQKKQVKRLAWSVGGSVAILAFLAIFGLKLLEGFSLFVAKIKGNTPTTETQSSLLLPPILDDTFEATNTATITVSGKGDTKKTILLYVNEEAGDTTTVDDKGLFSFPSVKLKDGANTISVKAKDDKGNTSDLSNVLHIALKKTGPLLELATPADKSGVIGEKNTVSVSGKTDEEATLTVNGRVVVIQAGGYFQYDFPLSEGSNSITIVSTDPAGNQTTVGRTVTYQK